MASSAGGITEYLQNMLKVLHVISHFELGGAEKCTFDLAHLTKGHIEIGIAAVLGDARSEMGMSMVESAKRDHITLFNGVLIPWKFGGFLAAALNLRRIVLEYRPDIVHLNTEVPEFAYLLGVLLDRRLRHIPVIRTIHNTDLWTSWERLGTWCEKKFADTPVIYVSEAARECHREWRARCGLEPVIDDAVIYNPISVSRHREQLGSSVHRQKEIRALFAGRFEYQKGADLLPSIIRQMKVPDDTEISLHIFGSGEYESLLSGLSAHPPDGWKILLRPPIANLVDIMADYDMLLFPSRFEGYGRLAAEAVLSGIPVIAFRLPVLMEIFPNDYPWLVPGHGQTLDERAITEYAKMVYTLIKTIESAQSVVDEARKQLSVKLDPENTRTAYLEFYQRHTGNPAHEQ